MSQKLLAFTALMALATPAALAQTTGADATSTPVTVAQTQPQRVQPAQPRSAPNMPGQNLNNQNLNNMNRPAQGQPFLCFPARHGGHGRGQLGQVGQQPGPQQNAPGNVQGRPPQGQNQGQSQSPRPPAFQGQGQTQNDQRDGRDARPGSAGVMVCVPDHHRRQRQEADQRMNPQGQNAPGQRPGTPAQGSARPVGQNVIARIDQLLGSTSDARARAYLQDAKAQAQAGNLRAALALIRAAQAITGGTDR